MNLIKRAGLYIARQKLKTIILFLVLMLLSTLTLIGLSIGSAAENTSSDMYRDIAGTISIDKTTPEIDHEAILKAYEEGGNQAANWELFDQMNRGDMVTLDTLDAITAVPGVGGYNITARISMMEAEAINFSFLQPIEGQVGSALLDEDDMMRETSLAQVHSATYSEKMLAFLGGNLRLVEGRHITESDYRKVMISDELAERNNLSVGDTLIFSGAPSSLGEEWPESRTFEFEIVGIFSGTRALEEEEFDNFLNLHSDALIIDMATVMEESERTNYFGSGVPGILPGSALGMEGSLTIYVDSPDELESVYLKIANLPEVSGKTFDITMGSEGFEDVINSLGSLQSLVRTLLVVIAVVSMAILAILLTIWIRGRVKEIGIYLSCGIKKSTILAQFAFEALIIAVVAFALALPVSMVTAQYAGDYILAQFASSEALRSEQLEGSTSIQQFSGGGTVVVQGSTGFMDEADIESALGLVDVGVSANDLIWVYVIGLPVVIVSVLIACYPVVRLKPREILTKMS